MKSIRLILLLVMIPAFSVAHPLHLSITNITYENGKLSISMKTFRDDWKTAYFHYNNRVVEITDKMLDDDSWFKNYLDERFRISLTESSKGLSLAVDTVMLDENAMTIEMHTATRVKANSLYIYNVLLTDIYPDQTNLVIFGFNNRETGIKFDISKRDAEVILR